MMKKLLLAVTCCALFCPSLPAQAAGQGGWPNYGNDPGGTRYSSLRQITPANVAGLGVAWSYDTGFKDRSFEATPLVVAGIMYVTTPTEQVVALDADTGRQLWKFDPHETRERTTRGVSYWPGDSQHPPRIVLATSGDGRLIELDAKTGEPVPEFGTGGSVVVREGLAPGMDGGGYGFTSPPAIYRNLLILSPDLQEGPSHGLPGTVSAFDAITGKLAWRFFLTAQPGQTGGDSWGPDGAKDRSGPAAWAAITVDSQRGLVFVNTANPADSYYGADRPGNNLFANSLVVLDAATGKLKWYFQAVHHDVTDTDMAGPPALLRAGPNGTPAVATLTKSAMLFILDRDSGKPIFGVEEKPVPPSDVPGEHSSPTQPFPVLPPPLARQSATVADVTTVTPASEAYCRQQFADYKSLGPYTPFLLEPTYKFPSSIGGANWGGVSYDPALGYIFVNTSDLGNKGQMVSSSAMPARGRGRGRGPDAAPRSATREVMPYRNPDVGQRFVDTNGFPCQVPPWGQLMAINAHTGKIAWQVPLGDYPELDALGVPPTGAPNIGGSAVTAAGLIFIGATPDGDFRAFDARSGKLLWTTALDGYGLASPMTYSGRSGKQYVAIAVGGAGSLRGVRHLVDSAPNRIVVFALGGRPATQAPAAKPALPKPAPTAAAPTGSAAASLPAGPGRDLVAQACTACHGLSTVTNVRADKDGWNATVNEMVGRGAQLTDQQLATVVAYLAKHFGPH